MEKASGIKFKRSALASFVMLTIADLGKKMALEVLHNVSEKNLVTSDKSGKESYIVSLKAIAPDKLPELRELFADAEEVDIEQTNGLFVTANIWKNSEETPALPMKGEKINCIIVEVPNRDGEPVIRVSNPQVTAAATGKKLDLQEFFAPAEKTEVAY